MTKYMMARGSLKARLSRVRGRLSARPSLVVGVVLVLAGCGGSGLAASSSPAGPAGSSTATSADAGRSFAGSASPSAEVTQSAAVPEPAHTIVVVMENHSYE